MDGTIFVENVQVFYPVSLRDDEEMFSLATEEEQSCPVCPLPVATLARTHEEDCFRRR